MGGLPISLVPSVHGNALRAPCPGSGATRGTVLSLSLWIQTPLPRCWTLDEPFSVPAPLPIKLRRGRCPLTTVCESSHVCYGSTCLDTGLALGAGPTQDSGAEAGDPLGCTLLPSGSSPSSLADREVIWRPRRCVRERYPRGAGLGMQGWATCPLCHAGTEQPWLSLRCLHTGGPRG